MRTPELRFRQIHMDFHTSGAIKGIGAKFDPDRFADTLKRAHVDSINLFARGHHGYIYYDTEQFPERRHPHLACDLLREQIEACHKRDIRAPIYITVQWDLYTLHRHPEWLMRNEAGAPIGNAPFAPGFYQRLCLNTPYVDWLKGFTEEVLDKLPVDGVWFDIVAAFPCACEYCQASMRKARLDPADPSDRAAFGVQVKNRFQQDMTAFVRKHDRTCLVFYNAGHVNPGTRAALDSYTHLELESLPSGPWGYIHFPATMRYARTLGKECLGMTGKFHTAWGDFHSFKNQAALEFECFHMLALNGKCSVGDQLHPSGKICAHTYDLVGKVFSQVEAKEPWCRKAEPVTEIAVFNPEEFGDGAHGIQTPPPTTGVTRMLQEARHQFDFVDSRSSLAGYKVAVLPDTIPVDDRLKKKLRAFVKQGGALLASHRSGLMPDGSEFALPELGVKLKGAAPFSPDFLKPRKALAEGLRPTEHVMYQKGLEVELRRGAEVLADAVAPYFNRTWEHFCSHRHTPSAGRKAYAAAVQKGRCVYFAHPVFTQYNENAPLWVKQAVLNALDRLLPEPLVRVDAPSTLLATLNEQAKPKRRILHLLHYIPERRGTAFDVIEDVIPLYNVAVSLQSARNPRRIQCVPDGPTLESTVSGGRVEFVVPELRGHQMIEIR